MGFWGTFKEDFGFTNFSFRANYEELSSKVVAKPRDENLMTNLWCQLAINNLLVDYFYEFM
jgi:hypothetical protein